MDGEPAVARTIIGRMCEVIAHRGPDDEGWYVARQVALGMRRLSIIDLASGHQPMTNEDGTIHIVFNGEIYNYRELRAELLARGHTFQTGSDTEVIVHLYEEEGERCVERLRGMFGFAIWDERNRALLLARDRVGKKPLHYALADGTLVFGSEIKSLLQHPSIQRDVCLESIADFLTFGYVPEPATAFRGIHRLPPGHTLIFRDGRVRTRRYWDFSYDNGTTHETAPDERACIEQLRERLAEAVRVRLVSEVPLGAFLSGGIDSSAVVAMMARATTEPVKTFSIGFTEASHDELQYARIVARRFQTDHHEFVVTPELCSLVEEIVWHHDEPFADVSSIPTWVVSRLAGKHVKVVLTGDGGDEVFAGYDRYAIHRRREIYERIPTLLRRGLLSQASRLLPQSAYGKNFLRNIALEPAARYVDSLSYFTADAMQRLLTERFREALAQHDSSAGFRELFARPASTERLDHLVYLDSRTYLPGDILAKVDRMSMAHSLETRAPLLDHQLIEFVQTIPASLRLKKTPGGFDTKYILKRALSGLVPDEIIHRRKQGFAVPVRQWFRHELRELLHDTLTDRRTRERGLFNPRTINAILDEHQRGRRDNSRHLWGLLTLEIWHRLFIDQRPARSWASTAEMSFNHLAVNAGAAAK
jgi:asparagine synthase (glutamine-hydrolysing)